MVAGMVTAATTQHRGPASVGIVASAQSRPRGHDHPAKDCMHSSESRRRLSRSVGHAQTGASHAPAHGPAAADEELSRDPCPGTLCEIAAEQSVRHGFHTSRPDSDVSSLAKQLMHDGVRGCLDGS